MAVSQYDKVLPWDPVQYFQIESSLGKDRLDRRDKQMDNAASLGNDFAIDPGPSTKYDAQKLQDELINPGMDDIYSSIQKGDDAVTIAKKRRDLQNKVKQHQSYWNIHADKEYNRVNDMYKTVANHEFDSNIQDFYDPETGFVQNKAGNPFNPQKHYSNIPIVDINQDAEIQNIFSKIRPELRNQWGAPYEEFSYGPDGEVIGKYRTTEGVREEKIDKNTIRQALSDAVMNNPHFIEAYPSLRYNRAYNNKVAKKAGVQYQYSPEQAIEDLTDAFIGKYSSQQDLAPKVQNVPIPKKSTSGNGNDKTAAPIYDPVMSTVEQVNTNGYAKANGDVVASMLGQGEYDAKANTIKANLAGTGTIISLARTTLQPGAPGYAEEQNKINEMSQLIKPLGTVLSLRDQYDIGDDETVVPEPKPSGTEYQWEVANDDYYNPGKKLSQDAQYTAALEMAKSLGYDLTKGSELKRLKAQVKKVKKEVDPMEMSLTADNLGDAELVLKDSPNVFKGNDGSMYVNVEAKVKETDLNSDDLNAAVKAGLASKNTVTEGDNEVTYFNVPVIKKVNRDIKDIDAEHLRKFLSPELYAKHSVQQANEIASVVNSSKTALQFDQYYPQVIDEVGASIKKLGDLGYDEEAKDVSEDLARLDAAYAAALATKDNERIYRAAMALLQVQKNAAEIFNSIGGQ